MTRINTNVTSLISARVLNQNQASLNKSLERLSTGLRINSGADDPSGLIASEVLRGETASLNAAISNGERASNVISTAEGALNEVSSLLVDLENTISATANTAGLSDEEVAANQLTVDSILSTINRIANNTEFEGTNLLNGSMDYTTSGNAATSAFDNVTIKSANLVDGAKMNVVVDVYGSAQLAKVAGLSANTGGNITLQITGNDGTQVFSFASGTHASAIVAAVKGSKSLTGVSAIINASSHKAEFVSTEYGEDAFVKVETISGTYIAKTTDEGVDAKVRVNGQEATAKGLNVSLNTSNLSISMDMKAAVGTAITSRTFAITGGGATFSLGADVTTGLASIGIQSIATGSLGDSAVGMLSSLADGQTNCLSSDNLGKAQDIVESAITQVASLRSRLGAFKTQTIDSTVNSLNVTLENTSAAESAIRDADFATETSNLTRSQILVQSATTVLKQANSAPQTALSLLS
jgi:flagellin